MIRHLISMAIDIDCILSITLMNSNCTKSVIQLPIEFLFIEIMMKMTTHKHSNSIKLNIWIQSKSNYLKLSNVWKLNRMYEK